MAPEPKVRIPRSTRTTWEFPSASRYSAAHSHSSMVADGPRRRRTGLPARPASLSSSKFCIEPEWISIMSTLSATAGTSRGSSTWVTVGSPTSFPARSNMTRPSSPRPGNE